MRLFVGIELDEAMRAAADDAAGRLRGRLKREQLHVDARWIPPENLHVTIWFIGEVQDARAHEIQTSLEPAFHIAPFDLGVGGTGAFPPIGEPRVFWFGITAGLDSLQRVYAEVGERFRRLGIEPERRSYSPHLTIARVKDVRRGAAREIRDVLARTPADCGTCRVSAVTLFRSRTSPKGAAYEPLLRVPLS